MVMESTTPSGGMCIRLTMRAEGALAEGDLALAESSLVAALEHAERADHEDRARALRLMGDLRERQGRLEEAEALFEQKAAAEEELYGRGDPRLLVGLSDLVRVRRSLEKPIDDQLLAAAAARAALVDARLAAGEDLDRSQLVHWYLVFARFYRAAGRPPEAEESYLEALVALRELGPEARPQRLRVARELGDFFTQEGQPERARLVIEMAETEPEDQEDPGPERRTPALRLV